jgi:RES domain-containing protein
VIRAWRLVKARYAATAFDGEGARLYGARWNSQGIRVAYASESVSLALLETLVHLQSLVFLGSYALVGLRFPEELLETLDSSKLPANWRDYPAPLDVQGIGDRWAAGARSLALSVPSVIVPSARNFLINPMHPDFERVTIDPAEPFDFDLRLLS